MDVLWQDLQHTLRGLRRRPVSTAVVILTLAIGIGLNTAIFTLIRSTLLRPLPYAEPERLVVVWTTIPARGVYEATSAFGNVEEWRAQTRAFEDLATWDQTTLTLTGGQLAERVAAVRTAANLFRMLGVGPERGRSFTASEERDGAHVVVVSHAFAESHLGGAAGAVGRSIVISGSRFEVIGVMPQRFGFPEDGTQLWLPQTLFTDWEATRAQRGTGPWRVLARLRSGATVEQARAELGHVAARLEGYASANAGLGATAAPLHEAVAGRSFRATLWILFGAVAFVLLLACANVAHMILARNMDRGPEYALRRALGATPRRLLRQTLTENAVLGVVAGAAALLLAQATIRLLVALAPSNMPRVDEIGIDAAVLIYAAIVSLTAALVVGTLPALGNARADLSSALRSARGTAGGRRGQRMRGALIGVQFALAIVLVFGANLFIRSLLHARSVDVGFTAHDVLIANLSVETPSRRIAFYEDLLAEVQAAPGVTAAALIEDLFISGAPGRPITIEGLEADGPALESIRSDAIAGDFFGTVGVQLREGRGFLAADHAEAPPVAIINQTMASRFWPGTPASGKRFRFGGAESPGPWIEVVGVVSDMRRQGPEREPIPQVFRPFVQEPSRNMNLVVHSAEPVESLAATIRARVAGIDRTVPLYHVTTGEQAAGRYLLQRRFETMLLGAFSAIAVILAAVGIYSLMQYSVLRRAHELAVRVALGASPWRMNVMVLRYALGLTLPGVIAGTLAALWLARSTSALFFNVAPTELENILMPVGVLLVTALAAAWSPARRAARADPITALRSG